MAVACMEMIRAHASGVMYTRNPVNPLDNRVLINAVWGLGPYAVDGIVPAGQLLPEQVDPAGAAEIAHPGKDSPAGGARRRLRRRRAGQPEPAPSGLPDRRTGAGARRGRAAAGSTISAGPRTWNGPWTRRTASSFSRPGRCGWRDGTQDGKAARAPRSPQGPRCAGRRRRGLPGDRLRSGRGTCAREEDLAILPGRRGPCRRARLPAVRHGDEQGPGHHHRLRQHREPHGLPRPRVHGAHPHEHPARPPP